MAEADKKLNLNKTASKYKCMYRKDDNTSSCSKYVLRKSGFSKFNRKEKHIYVNNKTHFKVLRSSLTITFKCLQHSQLKLMNICSFREYFITLSSICEYFQAQLYKCEKRLDNGASELIIHGLGAAIYKATNLALRLKEIHYGCLDFDIKTSTMQLNGMFACIYIGQDQVLIEISFGTDTSFVTDKLESLNDKMDSEINRQNSAIHIRVFRKIPVTVLRSTN